MARANGRNLWIAWPIGVICAAVVAALLYVAQPMIPVVAGWTAGMFHAATHLPPQAPARETVAAGIAAVGAEPGSIDCRSLYPDDLWAELTWTPDVLLSQTVAAPAGGSTSVADALAPTVLVTCSWRGPGATSIASTLGRVASEATGIADAALRAEGFSCTGDPASAAGVACSRADGAVIEEHVVRDGLWLATVQISWHPPRYGARLAANVWG